jgi:hypothetical protein
LLLIALLLKSRKNAERDEVQQLFPARLRHSGGVPQSVAANMCDTTMIHKDLLLMTKLYFLFSHP